MLSFLRLRFLQSRLALNIGYFLLILAFASVVDRIRARRTLVFSLMVAGIFCLSGLAFGFMPAHYPKVQELDMATLPFPNQISITHHLTRSQAIQMVKANREVLLKQPTSRTTLINTAILEDRLGNHAEALRLWNQAREIDPNFFMFVN